jgi:hypothetical protein
MLADYPKMKVTQDPNRMIRMTEEGVPTDILEVRIHHLSFDVPSSESSSFGPAYRGPNMAWRTILATPEVRAFRKAHNIGPDAFELPENGSDSSLPIVSGELEDVTVSQALDYILKTAPGYWVYENCITEDGRREVFFWFY